MNAMEHEIMDARSVAMHALVAEKFRQFLESVLANSRQNLAHWGAERPPF